MDNKESDVSNLSLQTLLSSVGLETRADRILSLTNFLSVDDGKVDSWLRSRLFEALISHEGLVRYLQSLNEYQGPSPEKEVKLNGLLAASHISTSLNALIYDIVV